MKGKPRIGVEPMKKKARHTKIIEKLHQQPHVDTKAFSEELQVSIETIRRDFKELEDLGQLKRTHGGAYSSKKNINESNLLERRVLHALEKKEVARKAMSVINEHDFIALDTSTTNLAIAKETILHFEQLTVLTNCLTIAQELIFNSNFTVLVPGGVAEKKLFIGGVAAVEYINQFSIDVFFMSVSGLDFSTGFMDYGLKEFEIKKAMLKNAHQIYVPVDHYKFGQYAKIKVCNFEEVDGIITDHQIAPNYIEYFDQIKLPLYY